MYGCESWTKKKSWAPKNFCLWTVVSEKTLESPLDCKEIQPVHPKGNQSWIFIGRTDAKAEAPILWPPDVKNWLTGKDPDARKDWRQKEKGTTEVGWYHQLDGPEFEQAPGVGDGQWSLELQRVGYNWTTELNWCTYLIIMCFYLANIWISSDWQDSQYWSTLEHSLHSYLNVFVLFISKINIWSIFWCSKIWHL